MPLLVNSHRYAARFRLARQSLTCCIKVYVCEPTVEYTVNILRGMKTGLQRFHGVRILDEAFVNAAYIASQYFAHKR